MKTLLAAFLCCVAAVLPAGAAAEGLLVQVPAVLDPSAPITNQVRNECGVPEMVGNEVLAHVSRKVANVRPVAVVPATSPEPVLKLTLVGVHGVGGGSWSGNKSVNLRAELVENGRPISAVVLMRSSRGGAFGGISGTCPIFSRIADALGKDVAAWVPGALSRTPARQALPAAPPEPAPAQ